MGGSPSGLRVPSQPCRKIDSPVLPVRSLTTRSNCTFICVRAFCMCDAATLVLYLRAALPNQQRNVHTRPPDGMHFAITHGHQLPDPLAVQHIGLAPRHLARRSRIPRCTSNPRASRTSYNLHPRRLHRHLAYAPFQPVGRPRNSSLIPRRTDSSAASGRTATQCSSLPPIRINDSSRCLRPCRTSQWVRRNGGESSLSHAFTTTRRCRAGLS